MVQSQLGQVGLETLSQKYPTEIKAGGVAQGAGPELKPHTGKN
jgi:hypothetical protein